MKRIINFLKSKWGIAIIIIVLIIGYFVFHKKPSTYTFVTVTRGSITDTVSVTGNTTPVQSVSLGFANSGTIAGVSAAVGDHVSAGQVLARLNTADLNAQLKQQQAQLDNLNAGSRPEDIAVSQAAVAKAGQDLSNMYGSIVDSANDAYTKANDAVRTQTSSLFSNAENTSISINFTTSASQASTDAKNERLGMATILNTWQADFANLPATPQPSDLDALIQSSLVNLTAARIMLNSVSATLNGAINLDTATLASDKTAVATGLNEVNTATTNLTTLAQNIASQKLVVTQAQAALALKQAGSSPQDIAAQEAVVESVQAKIANSLIVSPISGVVTQFDAKIGQTASVGTPLVSVISSSQFEVDAQVPETDVGKIAIGNPVDMTFDAFPGKTFTGKLFYIDPAQTINQGVVDYKIKVSFNTVDPQMKSGLTANLTIETKTDTDVLIVPQYAVLQNDKGTFVETLINGVSTTTPVTLGIQDENGNVEILSGVTEGEQLINIGLKQ